MSVISNWLWGNKETVPNSHALSVPKEAVEEGQNSASTVDINLEEESLEHDNTPKANPTGASNEVPSFNLDDSNLDPPPDTSRPDNVAQQQNISAMLPPALPNNTAASSEPSQRGLLPPPKMSAPPVPKPRNPTSSLGVTPSGLRLPSSGPLPHRGPPPSSAAQARSSLAPVPVANTAGKRNKVLLKPGHSPLDWAALSSSKNLSGLPTLQRVTPSMLKWHNGRKGRPAWSSYMGKVYNITPYLPFHPGGEGELMRAAGKDGAKLFMEYHAWVNWENMLNSCVVGILVSEGEDEGLDAMD